MTLTELSTMKSAVKKRCIVFERNVYSLFVRALRIFLYASNMQDLTCVASTPERFSIIYIN